MNRSRMDSNQKQREFLGLQDGYNTSVVHFYHYWVTPFAYFMTQALSVATFEIGFLYLSVWFLKKKQPYEQVARYAVLCRTAG